MRKLIAFLFLMLLSLPVLALEIDEKLTTRFLKVSGTKKTVLLNRGLEDGLVVGDHAKFFLTTGVIARGVLVKASPTRSIWSVYRIVDSDQIYADKVVNIKISTPLKLTEDPSQSLQADRDVYTQGQVDVIGIPLAEGAEVVQERKGLTEEERADIASMGQLQGPGAGMDDTGMHLRRTLEFWGLMHLNNLTTSSDLGTQGTSEGQIATIDFSLGIEKYFQPGSSFLSKTSFSLFIHSSSTKATDVEGSEVSNQILEYGVGANWHFMNAPLSYGRVIGFANATAGIGKVEDTVVFSQNGSTTEKTPLSGSSNFFSLGIGGKYYTAGGFGGRALLDYYVRNESYSVEDQDQDFTKTVSGPRVQFGLSYRW